MVEIQHTFRSHSCDSQGNWFPSEHSLFVEKLNRRTIWLFSDRNYLIFFSVSSVVPARRELTFMLFYPDYSFFSFFHGFEKRRNSSANSVLLASTPSLFPTVPKPYHRVETRELLGPTFHPVAAYSRCIFIPPGSTGVTNRAPSSAVQPWHGSFSLALLI